jgi:anti-anti-sigma regulatory factor
MEKKTYQKAGFLVIDVCEKVTMSSNLQDIRDDVSALIEQGTSRVAIRFRKDSYFSSRSIAVVVTCNERIRDLGGIFVIINPNEQIQSLLVSLGIEDRFVTCESEEDLLDLV